MFDDVLLDDEAVDDVDLAVAALQMILQHAIAGPRADIVVELVEQLAEKLVGAAYVLRRQPDLGERLAQHGEGVPHS